MHKFINFLGLTNVFQIDISLSIFDPFSHFELLALSVLLKVFVKLLKKNRISGMSFYIIDDFSTGIRRPDFKHFNSIGPVLRNSNQTLKQN